LFPRNLVDTKCRILLSDLPTNGWGEEDIKMLFSEAYTYLAHYKDTI
jgi:hypothetical protein